MAAVIPPQSEAFNGAYRGRTVDGDNKAYQANYRLDPRSIAPGATASVSTGCLPAPRWSTSCAAMRTTQDIAQFDKAIDWGWFCFLTRPFFWLLDNLYKMHRQFRPRHSRC